MWVKNKRGAAGQACSCGDWLKHWEKGARTDIYYCGTKVCMHKPERGALVLKAEGSDSGEYVVPLCAECIRREGEFEIGVALVIAREQPFCRTT